MDFELIQLTGKWLRRFGYI